MKYKYGTSLEMLFIIIKCLLTWGVSSPMQIVSLCCQWWRSQDMDMPTYILSSKGDVCQVRDN